MTKWKINQLICAKDKSQNMEFTNEWVSNAKSMHSRGTRDLNEKDNEVIVDNVSYNYFEVISTKNNKHRHYKKTS